MFPLPGFRPTQAQACAPEEYRILVSVVEVSVNLLSFTGGVV
jgi:hypothetical protein